MDLNDRDMLANVKAPRSKPVSKTRDMQQYYDHGLDASQREIRLVDLKHGSYDDDIEISLRTVSLNDNPRFNALSYAWGNASQKAPIRCNNLAHLVTHNLEIALRHLRHHLGLSVEDIPIWIDAICINQEDGDERNREVRRMRDIYSKAAKVLIWLGVGDAYSDELIDRLNDAEFMKRLAELRETPHRAGTREEIRAALIFNTNIDARPWWGRIWVLQELVLATKDPIILCGKQHTTWKRLIGYISGPSCLWSNYEDYDIGEYTKFQALKEEVQKEVPCFRFGSVGSRPYHASWAKIREIYHAHGNIPLHEVVLATKDATATDKHDIIYGQLGLLSEEEAASIMVDYEKSPMLLFMEVMKKIWTTKEVEVLAEVIPSLQFNFLRHANMGGHPSWVPNLADQMDMHEFNAQRLNDYSCDAESIWRSAKDANISVSSCSNILTLKGVEIDVISSGIVPLSLEDFVSDRGNCSKTGVNPLEAIEKLWVRGRMLRTRQTDILSRLHSTKPPESLVSFVSGVPDERIEFTVGNPHHLWETWLGRTCLSSKSRSQNVLETSHPLLQNWSEVSKSHYLPSRMYHRLRSRRGFITERGFVGIGTPFIKAGDIVTRPYGSNCHYVLHPREDPEGGYTLVGFAYLSGFQRPVDLEYYFGSGALHEQTFEIY